MEPAGRLLDGRREGREARVAGRRVRDPHGKLLVEERRERSGEPSAVTECGGERLRELALGSDVILVRGGNTANMLAVWRTHGFDRIAASYHGPH